MVGRTPWSARVPLDPPILKQISLIQTGQADEASAADRGVRPTSRYTMTSAFP